jgi:phosphoglucosamine mutase
MRDFNMVFGTDGIRGPANVGLLSREGLTRISQAIAIFLYGKSSHPSIIMGRDTRISGHDIESQLAKELSALGVEVFLLGVMTTPGVSYFTQKLGVHAGVMISASHNPYYDNGIKFFDEKGQKFSLEWESEFEEILENIADAVLPLHKETGIHEVSHVSQDYIHFLAECIPQSLTGIRVVVDCANGSGSAFFPEILRNAGVQVTTLYSEPNGVNINLNCGALATQTLQKEVVMTGAHMGIAIDGDADRVVFIDGEGSLIEGDQALGLFAQYLHSKNSLNHQSFVTTIMSNLGLDRYMSEKGIQVVRVPVGDRHVFQEMKAKDLILGGESSGHFIFSEYLPSGDGILSALMLLKIFQEYQEPLSKICKTFEKIPQIHKSIPVAMKPPLEKMTKFCLSLKGYEEDLRHQGRVLFRFSGTEPIARITVEGTDKDKIEGIANDLENTLKQELLLMSRQVV